ncbi:MAG: alpha/beta hydrolase [Acidobacteriota bacterium]
MHSDSPRRASSPPGAWTDARFTLERLQVDGHGLRRRVAPEGADRPAVLYIHGLGESALCFERLLSLPALAPWTQLAPDLLGYGLSAWPERARDLNGHADDLVRLLETLETRSVVLVGHSMGGVIGTILCETLARREPRVAGFVNVEGNIAPPDCTFSSLIGGFSFDDLLESGLDNVLDHIDALSGPQIDAERRSVLRAYQASMQLADPRTLHRNGRDLVQVSADGELAGRLARLDVPTLFLHGSPRGTGAETLERLAHAGVGEVEAFSPAGHWPFLDQPHAFAARLVRFLDSLTGSA